MSGRERGTYLLEKADRVLVKRLGHQASLDQLSSDVSVQLGLSPFDVVGELGIDCELRSDSRPDRIVLLEESLHIIQHGFCLTGLRIV